MAIFEQKFGDFVAEYPIIKTKQDLVLEGEALNVHFGALKPPIRGLAGSPVRGQSVVSTSMASHILSFPGTKTTGQSRSTDLPLELQN